jgi:hypothetical protein
VAAEAIDVTSAWTAARGAIFAATVDDVADVLI